MKVKMNVSIAGHAIPEYGLGEFSFVPGDIVDLDERLAQKWLAGGHASPVLALKQGNLDAVAARTETATLETPETAVLDQPTKNKRG